MATPPQSRLGFDDAAVAIAARGVARRQLRFLDTRFAFGNGIRSKAIVLCPSCVRNQTLVGCAQRTVRLSDVAVTTTPLRRNETFLG
jgi:hypothetical protein